MKTCILYSNKSSLTGKQLKQSLAAVRKQTSRRAKCDILVRWGSTQSFPSLVAERELNSLESVLRTSNKLSRARGRETSSCSSNKSY